MSEPIKIHPFDVYRLMQGMTQAEILASTIDSELQPNQIRINGVVYQQSTNVEATPEAKAIIQ